MQRNLCPDLSDTLLDRMVLNEANLTNAILSKTVLTRSDLGGAVIKGADFSDVVLDLPQKLDGLPRLLVINDMFGIVEGLMTTVHSITELANSFLSCCNANNNPPRRLLRDHQARTKEVEELLHLTSFPAAVGKVLPALNGKLTGMSFCVPTVDVSVVDLTVRLEKPAT
ncbi:uncharacterized protein LOC131657581 [Vicia villosa]|uniref:uncharacterized protein LOC131657581 n=1 Tax=Vicia villosa TaxID=3911 RepID=UPI00273B4810|nr:uncharacterized protein LOC131657581 [Vicia villosa]